MSATPLYFPLRGETAATIFGWYHAPLGTTRGAVAIATSHGDEYLCAFRAMRTLAERLAAAGFAVLRFDYHGTGDSIGSDRDPERLPAWLSSVHGAVDELRRLSGCSAVDLFGLRIGGALAAVAAADRQDVAGLVLWSPVVQGRAYLRELKAFNAMAAQEWGDKTEQVARGPEDEEAGGYFWGKETMDAVRAIDLRALPSAPKAALLIGRDELPVDGKLVEHLRSLGSDVEVASANGFAGMMTARHEAKLPEDVITTVEKWLRARPPVAGGAGTAPRTTEATGEGYREAAVRFGPSRTLFGIYTSPTTSLSTPLPGVVLVTIGANHHVGSNGLYVRVARQLAAMGYSSLRMDLSGIGDSDALPGEPTNVPYPPRALSDLHDGLAFLRERGHARQMLVGLCSGGYHTFQTALQAEDVDGVVIINSLIFAHRDGDRLNVTHEAFTNIASGERYKRALLDPEKWKRLLRGDIDLRRPLAVVADRVRTQLRSSLGRLVGRDAAPDDFGSRLAALCARGTDVLLLYSRDDPGYLYIQLHAAASLAELERHPRFEMSIIDGADHTFTPLWSQLAVEAALRRYFSKRAR